MQINREHSVDPEAYIADIYQSLEIERSGQAAIPTNLDPLTLLEMGRLAHTDDRRDVLGAIMQKCFDDGSNPNKPSPIDYSKVYSLLAKLSQTKAFTDPHSNQD